jgi:NRPS condensation-like uncharacterized protein
MRIDFDGHLDEAVLAKALEQSCVTFPLIACAFDTTPPIRPRWVPRREATREILQVVETQGDDHREEAIQRSFANSPNITEGPQLRIFLVRNSERDTLCLISNHMLYDGAGLRRYIRSVARLYSRIAEGIAPSPAPFVRQRGIWPVLKGFRLRDRLFTPARMGMPATEVGKKLLQTAGFAFEDGPFDLLAVSLPAESFKPLRATAKALGFTVNDLLVSALALAWHRVRKVDEFLLPCTMNLRGFAPPGVKMGITNFTCQCICAIRIAPSDMIENVMAKLVTSMKRYKQGVPGLCQLIGCWLLATFLPFRRMEQALRDIATSFPICASNAGIIGEDCVRFGDIPVQSVHLSAPTVFSPAFIVTMSTFHDELTIAFNAESDEAAKVFIRTVFAAMIEELKDFGLRHS